MTHISKADLAQMAKTDPFGARRIILANHEQYARDGYIGDAPPVAGAPAAPPPVANPPPLPPGMSFRERCAAAEAKSPGAGRAMALTDPQAYIDGTVGPLPPAIAAAADAAGAVADAVVSK